jgi:hypothetical protein
MTCGPSSFRTKPATTLVPTATPGFFLSNARIEINTIALKSGAKTKREVVDAGVFPAFRGLPQAIRAGDLLLLSGLLAIDENGLVESARIDSEQPYHGSTVQAQMDAMLESAEKICAAAGTSLETSYASSSTTPIPPTSMALIRRGTDTFPAATCRSRP